ncbi:hypothetical protein QCA50_007341 [Cerrena zonata]|uniref:DUF6532 domain-containing protein n=1 Tax=Cerrena zonata TaxID=2478898 RepID=A0AAW0GD06_9APHY
MPAPQETAERSSKGGRNLNRKPGIRPILPRYDNDNDGGEGNNGNNGTNDHDDSLPASRAARTQHSQTPPLPQLNPLNLKAQDSSPVPNHSTQPPTHQEASRTSQDHDIPGERPASNAPLSVAGQRSSPQPSNSRHAAGNSKEAERKDVRKSIQEDSDDYGDEVDDEDMEDMEGVGEDEVDIDEENDRVTIDMMRDERPVFPSSEAPMGEGIDDDDVDVDAAPPPPNRTHVPSGNFAAIADDTIRVFSDDDTPPRSKPKKHVLFVSDEDEDDIPQPSKNKGKGRATVEVSIYSPRTPKPKPSAMSRSKPTAPSKLGPPKASKPKPSAPSSLQPVASSNPSKPIASSSSKPAASSSSKPATSSSNPPKPTTSSKPTASSSRSAPTKRSSRPPKTTKPSSESELELDSPPSTPEKTVKKTVKKSKSSKTRIQKRREERAAISDDSDVEMPSDTNSDNYLETDLQWPRSIKLRVSKHGHININNQRATVRRALKWANWQVIYDAFMANAFVDFPHKIAYFCTLAEQSVDECWVDSDDEESRSLLARVKRDDSYFVLFKSAENRLIGIRGKIKKHLQPTVATAYCLGDTNCSRLVRQLRKGKRFLYPGSSPAEIDNTLIYQHPCIIQSISSVFFTGPKSFVSSNYHDFKVKRGRRKFSLEVTEPMVALVGTIIEIILSDWETGVHDPKPLNSATANLIYKGHAELLKSIRSDNSQGYYHMMAQIFHQASNGQVYQIAAAAVAECREVLNINNMPQDSGTSEEEEEEEEVEKMEEVED